MKTLAEVKRRVKVGMVLTCEHHLKPAISGPRPIVKVQANAIAYSFTTEKGEQKTGWCYWPKAAEVKVDGDRVTFLDQPNGSPAFTYVFPLEAAA
jgi:hypothetical protein